MNEQHPKMPGTMRKVTRDGMTLLIDPERPAWAMVNNFGVKVADLCDGKRTAQEIADTISAAYNAPMQVVARDVGTFIQALEKAGLVYYGAPAPVERVNLADRAAPVGSVCFELTERCNLQCAHCFEEAGPSCHTEPSTEDVISWMDKFAQVHGITFNLSGGEFLTRKDWREIVAHAGELKASTVVLTNGTLLSDEVVSELKQLISPELLTVQISLDGPDAKTNDPVRGKGSFDRIAAGLRMLGTHGIAGRSAISFTPNKLNADRLDDMIALAQDLGVGVLHISILHRMGRATGIWRRLKPTTRQMTDFFDKLHTRSSELAGTLRISGDFCSLLHDKVRRIPVPLAIGCRLGVDIKVDVHGDIYPCPPMSYDRKYCVGNMREMSAEEICTSPRLRELRALFVPRLEQSPGCRTCAWKCFCSGGCIGRAEQNYGTIYHADDLCGVAKELYLRTFFRQAEAKRSPAHAQAR